MNTRPGNLISDLELPNCNAKYDMDRDLWTFRCGHQVTGEVVNQAMANNDSDSSSAIAAIVGAHKTHHDEHEPEYRSRPWAITTISQYKIELDRTLYKSHCSHIEEDAIAVRDEYGITAHSELRGS